MSWLAPITLPVGTFALVWPRSLDEKAVTAFFAALAAEATPSVAVFEVVARGGQIRHQLTLPSARSEHVLRQLRALVPGVHSQRVPVGSPAPAYGRAWRLKVSSHRRPLRSDNPAAVSLGILSALSGTHSGEVLCLQWLLGPRLRPVAIPNRFHDFTHESWWQTALSAPFGAPGPVDPEFRRALAAKQGLAGWRAVGRLAVHAATPARERQLLGNLLAAIRVAESPGLKVQAAATHPATVMQRQSPRWRWQWPNVLNEGEVIGLVGWPLGDAAVMGLIRGAAAVLPAAQVVPRVGRVIGDSSYGNGARPLAISVRDALHHTWLIGPTGVGKSTLMANLLLQDAAAGRAAVVIDSKGDLVDDILQRLPEKRLADVVVLDPSDLMRPVGLNPLAGRPQAAALGADQLLGVFHSLYGDNLGPRSQDILHACLLTLARYPRMSICAMPLLLSSPGFRRRLTRDLDDPLGTGSFWQWYESVSEAERQASTAPIMNKLRAFLLRPAMRRVLGQVEPSFRFRQIFTERKLLLVNLAKGLLGPETAQLFGALVFSQLWQATLSRVDIAPERRHPVMVHLDEFQDYLRLPLDFGDVLAQSRSLGVGLTLAHQHLAQLTLEVRSALLANAGSRVCFRLGQDDAAVLARGGRIPTPEDFGGLGRYQAYASLLAGGERAPWASVRTRPLSPTLRLAETARAQSRAVYGQDGAAVEAALTALVAGEASQAAVSAPIGRRPGGGRQ